MVYFLIVYYKYVIFVGFVSNHHSKAADNYSCSSIMNLFKSLYVFTFAPHEESFGRNLLQMDLTLLTSLSFKGRLYKNSMVSGVGGGT